MSREGGVLGCVPGSRRRGRVRAGPIAGRRLPWLASLRRRRRSPSSRRVRRMCPGWQRGPHAATDLVVDHVWPRTLAGGVQVLWRACNSRKGASCPAL